MKILAINGSPRKNSNTATLLKKALEGAAAQGAETELIHLYDLNFKGCISCFACKLKDGKSYGINEVAALARKSGMKVHSWTHRKDAPLKGCTGSRQVLDAAFMQLKLDGLFSDFPDVVVEYLKQHALR